METTNPSDPARLDAESRRRALDRMESEHFDVAIIGGGVTGAGAALDAAARGLSVALIEQRDWASGTSSRSSKLIHGGLRYLEQLDLRLVFEAKREQGLMLSRLCPHLVHPVPFLLPLFRSLWDRVYLGAGVLLYDLLAGRGRSLPLHRHLGKRAALRAFPALSGSGLKGAIQYYDAQVDDARHTLALVRTAALHGAAVASSARVERLAQAGQRVTGVELRCLETGREIRVRARQVVNATGVWTDEIQQMAGRGRIQVRASKGIHLVIPRDRIHADSGLILRTAKSVLFVIPWKTHWIVGTTDSDWNLDLAHPAASERDVDYLLGELNRVLGQKLGREDIEGVYAGLRPLLRDETEDTSRLSREHAVSQSVSGLITVAGGKYTTYRVMAQDAVDVVARGLERRVPPSCSDRTPLVGAEGFQAVWNRRQALAEDLGLHVGHVEHLLRRYGARVDELVALVRRRPELGEPLEGAPNYLCVEAYYAASHEGALHLEDVLTRRTRISIETFDRGITAARPVADFMGEVLGWDDTTRQRELAHYDARVEAERESQQQPDDHTADAARLGAPDVRLGTDPGAAVLPLPQKRGGA